MQAGAFIDQADRQGRTPLYVAAERDHHGIVTQLLTFGANPAKKAVSTIYASAFTASLLINCRNRRVHAAACGGKQGQRKLCQGLCPLWRGPVCPLERRQDRQGPCQ